VIDVDAEFHHREKTDCEGPRAEEDPYVSPIWANKKGKRLAPQVQATLCCEGLRSESSPRMS
jgi:hypothetical protein